MLICPLPCFKKLLWIRTWDCDAEIDVVNRTVDRAIIGHKAMCDYCKTHMEIDEKLAKRRFFLANENEIMRDRTEVEVKALPQSRRIHQIKNADEEYVLQTREPSCVCKQCRHDEDCINGVYVKPFSSQSLPEPTRAYKGGIVHWQVRGTQELFHG